MPQKQRNKMAAVAREPGAAAVPTTSPPEPGPPDPAQNLPDLPDFALGLSEQPQVSYKDEERRHVPEKASVSTEANAELKLQSPDYRLLPADCTEANAELVPQSQDCAQFSPRAENPELPQDHRPLKPVSDIGPGAEQDPVQSAVSPLSLPAAPEAPEAGLSLGQPNGPDRACTDRSRRLSPERSERFTALLEAATRGPRVDDPGASGPPETESSPELRPGTHVRVSLDHVIDDALVVSFRVGHKVFSGVLMDLSRRFGPYGIPITVVPPRRESSRRHVQAETPPPPAAEAQPPTAEAPPPDPVPTPLFHQGAPYPPPLFLRDSYHTNLPQPPPRRIKRSRRRYGNSEEPTCMLVRLRPRQVLCDRCKGAAGPRVPPVSTRRRPHPEPPEENLSAEVKRLRCDEPRPPRPRRDGPKASGGGASAPPPRRPTTAASTRDARTELRDTAARSSPRSAPGPAHSSAHRVLTRRIASALTPPRIRLKPHRYRTEAEPPENKTRTRPRPAPSPRVEPGPQRSKTSARAPPKPPRPPRTRPESRHDRKDPRPEPGPKPEAKAAPKARPPTQSEIQTKTPDQPRPDPDQPRPDPDQPRPDPDPDSQSHPPAPLTPSRSRRKQVFPRPSRDFDLDFMGWCGPDSDLDRTEPGLTLAQKTSPAQNHLISGEKSETRPEPDQDLDQVQGFELKPDPVLGSEPTATEGPEVRSRPDPSPDSDPKSIKPDPDPPKRALLETRPERDRSPDPAPEPGPDLGPDNGPDLKPSVGPVLPEPGTRESPVTEPRVRSRSRSSSLMDSGPSSPASSSSGSSRSRSRSRTSEQSESKSESQCSTRSKSVSKPSPAASAPSNARPSVSPRPDSRLPRPDPKPDPRPDSRPPQSRVVQKCVGADGRCVCVGDIVWAKIAGFPWWPARVLSLTVCRRGDGGVAMKQEARVAWFGSRTTSLLPLSHTSPFLETFQTRFDRKRKGPYRRAIGEAANAAKQLTPEVRALIMHSDT